MIKTTEIIYIDTISAAKICSAVSLVAGFLISLMVTIPAAFYGISTFFTDYSSISGGNVFISVIYEVFLLTVIFTISGCVAGTVISVIYNLTASVFGGLEIEMLDEEIYVEEKAEENPIGYE